MTRSCPKCGQDPSPVNPAVEGFCANCYFERHPLIILRRPPEAKVCPRCQAYYTKGRWVHLGPNDDTDHIFNMVCQLLDPLFAPSQPASFEVRLHSEPSDPISKAKEIQVEVVAQAEDVPYEEQKLVPITITPVLCKQCKQSAGGYFEAILQIRAASGKLQPAQEDQIAAYLSQHLAESELPASALKYSETRGGFDVKCLSGRLCRVLAKNIAEKFGLLFRVSSKIAGRTREGKNLRRDTYSLRFPPFQKGDVLAYKQKPHMITGLHHGRYSLTNLLTENRETLSPKNLSEIDAELLNDEIETFQVISKEDTIYQLMRQSDFTLFDLPRPEQDLEIGSMVSAIEWQQHLVLLPTPDNQTV